MHYKYKFTIHNFIGESLYETSCIKLHVIISKFTSTIVAPVQLSQYQSTDSIKYYAITQ